MLQVTFHESRNQGKNTRERRENQRTHYSKYDIYASIRPFIWTFIPFFSASRISIVTMYVTVAGGAEAAVLREEMEPARRIQPSNSIRGLPL
jgi:hypothetical protein